MSRTTLDIIGLAGKITPSCTRTQHSYYEINYTGFDYKFNALSSDPEKNELVKSFSTIFKAGGKPSIIPLLKAIYPPQALRLLVRISVKPIFSL